MLEPQGGGGGDGIPEWGGPEKLVFITSLSNLPLYMSNHKVVIETTHVI